MDRTTENDDATIMKSKVYNVTSKDDGVTWGTNALYFAFLE